MSTFAHWRPQAAQQGLVVDGDHDLRLQPATGGKLAASGGLKPQASTRPPKYFCARLRPPQDDEGGAVPPAGSASCVSRVLCTRGFVCVNITVLSSSFCSSSAVNLQLWRPNFLPSYLAPWSIRFISSVGSRPSWSRWASVRSRHALKISGVWSLACSSGTAGKRRANLYGLPAEEALKAALYKCRGTRPMGPPHLPMGLPPFPALGRPHLPMGPPAVPTPIQPTRRNQPWRQSR